METQLTKRNGYLAFDPTNGGSRFPSFLQGFNRRWNAKNCKKVFLCYDAAGATEALNIAIADDGGKVKIKSGGHCYENFVFNEETMAIIDVTPMNACCYDEDKGFFLESGGTNWTAFQALLRDYGKILPAGSCYSVGLGGHICGGGYGLLSRLNGLTVDWLTGVEVIVTNETAARLVYASKDSQDEELRDLFWAHTGGGGGNFGIITKYFFATLPDAPKSASITSLAFPWTKLNEPILGALLSWFADFAASKSNWRQFGIFALNHQSAGEIHFTLQTAIIDGEDENEIYRNFIAPVLDSINKILPYQLMSKPGIGHLNTIFHNTAFTIPYTIYEAVQTLNGSGANQRGKYKSAYMRKAFPASQISAIYKWLTTVPNGLNSSDMAQSLLQVDSYGGAINTKNSAETAIVQRSSIFKLQYQTYWSEPLNDCYHLDWIHNFYKDVYSAMGGVPDPLSDPENNVDGCYYNYPDVDLNGVENDKERALKLYFGDNLKKLQRIKKRWDPNNYFNNSQSL